MGGFNNQIISQQRVCSIFKPRQGTHKHGRQENCLRKVSTPVLATDKENVVKVTEEQLSKLKVQTLENIPTVEKPKSVSEIRIYKKQREQFSYQVSAVAATLMISGMAILATYYRFVYLLPPGQSVSLVDMGGTLSLICLGVVGMEMYARWAHKALWHDFMPGWALHKSHHEVRQGMFEENDVFAVMNALPAIVLCAWGFWNNGLFGSMAYGAGLGITLFGIMYMFVHDGFVHKRFPVGPIEKLPYFQRIGAAHKIHHTEKFEGVPYGLFLGPAELEELPGGKEHLDEMVEVLYGSSTGDSGDVQQ